jgi:hypothetical protein
MKRHDNSFETLEVKYACGHSEVRARSQSNAVNEIVIKRAARMLCNDCLAEHQAERKRMIADSVQRNNVAAGSIRMTGSKKQIEWAERIRERWLDVVTRDIPPLSIKPSVDKADFGMSKPAKGAVAVQQAITNVLAARLAAIDEVVARDKAAWWIDFREDLDRRINKKTDDAISAEFSSLLDNQET